MRSHVLTTHTIPSLFRQFTVSTRIYPLWRPRPICQLYCGGSINSPWLPLKRFISKAGEYRTQLPLFRFPNLPFPGNKNMLFERMNKIFYFWIILKFAICSNIYRLNLISISGLNSEWKIYGRIPRRPLIKRNIILKAILIMAF